MDTPYLDVLRGLSSFLGQGLALDTTDPKEFDTRIREGIDTLLRVECGRARLSALSEAADIAEDLDTYVAMKIRELPLVK